MGAIQSRNTSESFWDGIREKIQAANFPSAEDSFHLRPHLLNGIEIRTVGRKIQHAHVPFLHKFLNRFDVVKVDRNQLLGAKFGAVIIVQSLLSFYKFAINARRQAERPRFIRGII